jgi:CRP-like cAMP-binding protein
MIFTDLSMGNVDNLHAEFVKKVAFFSGLPDAELFAFLRESHMRDMSKDEQLFRQGDRAESFFLVVSGWVKLYRHSIDGVET